jgi:hypothetical protein
VSLQEQLDALRDGLSESQRLNQALTERALSLQTALETQQLEAAERQKQSSALKQVTTGPVFII